MNTWPEEKILGYGVRETRGGKYSICKIIRIRVDGGYPRMITTRIETIQNRDEAIAKAQAIAKEFNLRYYGSAL